MRASRPTAWPTLALEQIFTQSLYVLISRFRFFHNGDPADPFIARERRQAIPLLKNFRIAV